MIKTNSADININTISEGNETEFEKLFKAYHQKLHRFSMMFVHSKELADEVVMDVFYKMWNKRQDLPTINNIETYLYISVRNLSFTVAKREDKYKFEDLDNIKISIPKYNSSPESKLITQENIKEINQAIETLPSKCKVIFKLIREEGMSKKEVSQILNISIKTIDNQIAIAVKKIAEVLNIDLSVKNYSAHIQTFLLVM